MGQIVKVLSCEQFANELSDNYTYEQALKLFDYITNRFNEDINITDIHYEWVFVDYEEFKRSHYDDCNQEHIEILEEQEDEDNEENIDYILLDSTDNIVNVYYKK